MTTRHIIPHLWFDTQAKEAVEFYVSLFENSSLGFSSTLHDTPSGDAGIVSFTIDGQPFMAISAGPYFKANPSVSFMLNFDPKRWPDAEQRLNAAWEKLSEGGEALMPIQEYPFSKRYGWVQDRFGMSWQLILTNPEGEDRPFITPSLMFTKEGFGKANEAIDFYTSVFKDGTRGTTAKFGAEMGPEVEGKLMYADFSVMGTWLVAMDGPGEHAFSFNEAISLLIPCDTQEEIDYYWEKLSAVPESEQCGWLKDKFGVSWQVHPTVMGEMMAKGTPEQVQRVTQAFLKMKKFDIAALQEVFAG